MTTGGGRTAEEREHDERIHALLDLADAVAACRDPEELVCRLAELLGVAAKLVTERLAEVAGDEEDTASLEAVERRHIRRVLEQANWTIGGPRGAAARLGIKRTTLQSRMEKLGIARSAGMSTPRRNADDASVAARGAGPAPAGTAAALPKGP